MSLPHQTPPVNIFHEKNVLDKRTSVIGPTGQTKRKESKVNIPQVKTPKTAGGGDNKCEFVNLIVRSGWGE